MEPFRDRLKQASARAGVEYSQTEIARSLGIGKQTVDRWFAGGSPKPDMLYRIAEMWQVDARWLATGEGNMIPAQQVLSVPERELIQSYRKAGPQKRLMLQAVIRAMGKTVVVASLAIPAFVPTQAEAAFNITFNCLHIARQWLARLRRFAVRFLTVPIALRTAG